MATRDLDRTTRQRRFRFDPLRRKLLKGIAGGLLVGSSGRPVRGASEPRQVEIAVVGAGLFGASAAMHLTSSGAPSVLLIGPSELPGDRSEAQVLASHYDETRNATAMDSDPEWSELARRSLAPLRTLEKRTRLEIFDEIGSLRVSQGELATGYFDLDGIRATTARLGIGVVALDSSALATRFPELRFDADSRGLFQERDAGMIRPRRLVAALRQVAVEEGAQWLDDAVGYIEPTKDHVDLLLRSGTRIRAQRILVATGAASIGHAFLAAEPRANLKVLPNVVTRVEVGDDFEATFPPTMVTTSGGGEFFAGFVAPPVRYPDDRLCVKAVGQTRSLADGTHVSDSAGGSVRALERLLPSLAPGAVHSRICMTTDTGTGRPVIGWVDDRVALALGGNGKGAKAALEIGRRAAALFASAGGAYEPTRSEPRRNQK